MEYKVVNGELWMIPKDQFEKEGITEITIPKGVTRIGAFNFASDFPNLQSINIPEGVTSIGEQAFGGCRNLTAINIPETVTEIGPWAFTKCENLSSVNIPFF